MAPHQWQTARCFRDANNPGGLGELATRLAWSQIGSKPARRPSGLDREGDRAPTLIFLRKQNYSW